MSINKKVLVVDDSGFARRMCARAIQEIMPTATITQAANGDEAIELQRADPFDMAIVDYNMPGQNGIKVAEELQGMGRHTKIILCTANIQTSIVAEAKEMGIGFIAKPIDPERLKEHVND